MNKTIKELAVELTIEITSVCDNIKGRSVFINQLLRSCSSIGANSYEAKYAQSTADFLNKLEIALKECYETDYWLEILFKVGSIDENISLFANNIALGLPSISRERSEPSRPQAKYLYERIRL